MPDAVDHVVGTTPADIVQAKELTVGKTYYGQNLSTTATLFGRPGTNQPALTVPAFRYEAGADFEFTVKVNEKIWMWTDESGGCPIILNEV